MADERKKGLVKEIKIPGLEMTRSFYLITHKKRTLPHPYSSFKACLKEFRKESL